MNRTTFLKREDFDGTQSECVDESVVAVEGDRIVAVERTPGASISGNVVDVARMPYPEQQPVSEPAIFAHSW